MQFIYLTEQIGFVYVSA